MTENALPEIDLGAPCWQPGCAGELIEFHPHGESCTCHLGHPPCGWCTDTILECSVCGWTPEAVHFAAQAAKPAPVSADLMALFSDLDFDAP